MDPTLDAPIFSAEAEDFFRQCVEQVRGLPPMQLLPVPKGWPGQVVMYDSDGAQYALFTRDDLPRDAGPLIQLPWTAATTPDAP